MKYHVKIINEFNISTVYIREINHYYCTEITFDNDEFLIEKDELKKFIKDTNSMEFIRFSNIIDKRENLIYEDIYNEDYWGARYSLCFHISRKCNLACKYCFGGEEHLPKEMSFKMIKKCIDFFIFEYGKNARQYIIDLSGSGEPLIHFELVKQIEEYADSIRNELGKDIMIMFCTNATLIDKEKAEYFKSKNRILLGVSIDGDESQNSNRVYKDGREVFHNALYGIELLSPKPVGFAVTVTHNNESVDEIFEYLSKIENCDCISIQNVRDFSKNEHSFYNINVDNVMDHYKKMLHNMYIHIKDGDYEYLLKLLRGSDTLGKYMSRVFYKGILFQFRCDGGKTRLVADGNGELYSCSVMNGCDAFKVGNIYEGISDTERMKHTMAVDSLPNNCPDCWASYICSGECNAISYYTHKDLYTNNLEYCEYRKKLISLAISFLNKIQKELPNQYKKISEYFIETSNYEYLDAGIWATFHLLKILGYKTDYSKIVDELNNTERGIKPSEIVRYVNEKCEKAYGIYQLFEDTNIENMKYPAIAIITKWKRKIFLYCLILGMEENHLKVKMMEDSEILDIDKKLFFEKVSDYIICENIQ